MERKRVYKELFPDRMMKDYIRLEKVESPLLELIPELNKNCWPSSDWHTNWSVPCCGCMER